jgi:hypothetical protein
VSGRRGGSGGGDYRGIRYVEAVRHSVANVRPDTTLETLPVEPPSVPADPVPVEDSTSAVHGPIGLDRCHICGIIIRRGWNVFADHLRGGYLCLTCARIETERRAGLVYVQGHVRNADGTARPVEVPR